MHLLQPASPQLRPDLLSSSYLDEKLSLLRQEIEISMGKSIKAAIADAFTLVANKTPSTIVISPEVLCQSVQQALEQNKESSRINSQLGR
jgi:hypothetical protein